MDRAFLGVSALLFAASVAVTILWCTSMSAMCDMPMPGGWTMSMTWMRMPGQTWPGAAASFLGMWVVMTVAMMLPALLPMLWRYRQAVRDTGETSLARLTTLVGAGYFVVWTAFGAAVYPIGTALAALAMQQPALSASRAGGDRRRRADRGRAAIHRLEGSAPWLLPERARTRTRAGARRRQRLAPRASAGASVRRVLRQPDGHPPRDRNDGPARDAPRDGRDHGRTPRTGR